MGSLRKLVRVWLALSSAAMLAVPAVPQEATGQGPVIRSQVNLVNVFATVRDKNKRIIGDLKQEDFKIVEDGQDQKIAFFSKEVSLPITLGSFAGYFWQRTGHARRDSSGGQPVSRPGAAQGR